MPTRNKKSYLTLILHILQLLFLESKLKHKIHCCESDIDGMDFFCKDASNYKDRLVAVEETLKRIARNHADLIELLRERLTMKLSLGQNPHGNAGHYNQLKIKEELYLNKQKISDIIDDAQLSLGI